MSRARKAALAVTVLVGIAIGLGAFTFVYARGRVVPDQRPRGVRQLPRDDRALRRVDQEQPPRRGRLQRLPRAAQPRRQVHDEGGSTASGTRSTSPPGATPTRCASPRATSEVTEHACRYCHQDVTDGHRSRRAGRSTTTTTTRLLCTRCHDDVGHWVALNPRWPACIRAEPMATTPSAPERRPGRPPLRARRRSLLWLALGGAAPRWPRSLVALLLTNIFQRKAGGAEPVLPRGGAERHHHRSGGVGKELPPAVRRLPPHGGHDAHALRRQRGHAARPQRRRPARHGGAVAAGGGPAAARVLGGVRVLHGLSRGARPRVHAGATRSSRSGSWPRSSRAPASTATRPSTCRTGARATAT